MLDSLHAGHVLALAVYGAMVLILRGRLGRGAGLHDLFRDKAAHAALFNDPPVRERAQAAETKGKSWQFWLSPGFTTMALFTLWIGITLILLGLPLPPVLPSDADVVGPAHGWTALGALLVLSLFALAIGRLPRRQAPESGETSPALLRRALGLGAGLLAVMLIGMIVLPMLQAGLLPVIDPSGRWWGLLSTLALFVLALLGMVAASWMWVQTGAAWFMLLIVLTTGFALLAQVPVLLLLLAGVVLLVWLVRRLVPFRYRIPGIPARYYENPISPHAPPAEAPPALVPPQEALAAWHARDHETRADKPRLVMLALSGGGYRATFWASAVLDELIALDGSLRPDGEGGAGEGLDGLARSIRFIAGASGGMVTGAYLAELSARAASGGPVPESLTGFVEQDILAYQQQRRPIRPPGMAAPPPRRVMLARDSLSAVAWQMLRDMGHIFCTGRIERDRARVLQAHWDTLDRPFAALREEEAQGIRPSVVFSPMLIESGAPFFISNLDLRAFRTKFRRNSKSNADDHSAELFRVLPGAHAEDGLTVATAARLSATFPYIVPAVSLPTAPHRRVVDAGYYDNYGIDVVTGILNTDEVRDWVVRNCSGVLVIALRAFADESQQDTPDAAPEARPAAWLHALARLFWWLTSPVEAMFNARGSSQSFRNQEQLRLTRKLYGAALAGARAAEGGTDEKGAGDWQQQGRDFVDIVTFACAEESSMSWHLSATDMRRLRRAAKVVTARERADMKRLLKLWNGQQGRKPPQA